MKKFLAPAAAAALLIGTGVAMAAGPGAKAPDTNAQNPSKQTIQSPSGKTVKTAPTTGGATTGAAARGSSGSMSGNSKDNVGSVGADPNAKAGEKVKER
jgi:hypothetical protein